MRAATSALALWFAVAVVSHASPSTRQLTPTASGEWVLGAPGLSCTQACGKFSPCDAGSTEAAHAAFSASPAYFSIFMENKFGVTCGNIETAPAACNGEVGPYFNVAKGLCGTSLQTSPVDCGATCADSIQRICCCGGNCPMLPPAPTALPTPTATPTPMPTPETASYTCSFTEIIPETPVITGPSFTYEGTITCVVPSGVIPAGKAIVSSGLNLCLSSWWIVGHSWIQYGYVPVSYSVAVGGAPKLFENVYFNALPFPGWHLEVTGPASTAGSPGCAMKSLTPQFIAELNANAGVADTVFSVGFTFEAEKDAAIVGTFSSEGSVGGSAAFQFTLEDAIPGETLTPTPTPAPTPTTVSHSCSFSVPLPANNPDNLAFLECWIPASLLPVGPNLQVSAASSLNVCYSSSEFEVTATNCPAATATNPYPGGNLKTAIQFSAFADYYVDQTIDGFGYTHDTPVLWCTGGPQLFIENLGPDYYAHPGCAERGLTQQFVNDLNWNTGNGDDTLVLFEIQYGSWAPFGTFTGATFGGGTVNGELQFEFILA
mmetsp:Transcript_15510/g.33443  ORF Transcript_15510/g.33443 Transcript_15510/m.33443 type:complete len:545 (+) Transcript_15510:263-1897(+)